MSANLVRHSYPSMIVVVLTVLISLYGLTSTAFAQGTMQMLPDPITSGELSHYSDRLGLSHEQRRAVQGIHDEYLRDFRSLRDGEIASFMKKIRDMSGGMVMIPSREVIDDMLEHWNRIQKEIERLDDRLFMQMQPFLTEQQLRRMHRAKSARERQRLRVNLRSMPVPGIQLVDVSSVVLSLDVPPTERQRIDPILESYERRLTREFRELSEIMLEMMLSYFEIMSEFDLEEEDMMDPDRMQEMMEAMQAKTIDREKAIRERVISLYEYNERTVRQIADHLDEDTARFLRHRFIGRTFQQTDAVLRQSAERRLQAAVRIPTLTAEQVERLNIAMQDVRADRQRIIDALVRNEIENIEEGSTFRFDQERWQKHHNRVQELHAQARQLDQDAADLISALLETEQQEAAESAHETVEAAYLAAVFDEHQHGSSGAADAHDEVAATTIRHGPDPHLPDAINTSDLAHYGDILDLDDEQKLLMHQLHEVYVQNFETITQNEIQELVNANQQRWQRTDDGGWIMPPVDLVERIYSLRERALEKIRQTDETFFTDLTHALFEDGHPHMDRVRRSRQRVVYSAVQFASPSVGGEEGSQDLLELARRASIHRVDRERMAELMDEYEMQLIEHLARIHRASRQQQKDADLWQIEMMRRQQDDPEAQTFDWREYQEMHRMHVAEIQELHQAVAELNRQTLEGLQTRISEDAHRSLRQQYLRRSYPSLHADPTSIETHLDRAMSLPDVTDDQRMALRELVSTYRPEYTRLTESMIEIRRSSDGMPVWGSEDDDSWSSFMEMQEEISRRMFERDELNSRAISTLRSILYDEQLEQLGDLPDPQRAQRRSPHFY